MVDRLWPRGLKKEALRGVRWMKDVAPNDALRRWYGHDPKKWQEFRRRYFAELDSNPEAWKPILEAARRADVILPSSAHDTSITTPQRFGTIGLRSQGKIALLQGH